jgi:BolA protein
MRVQEIITQKLQAALEPTYLSVENESHMHSVPAGSETHFRVVVASKAFEGLSRVRRQQKVYGILGDELKTGVHALGLQTFTPDEWGAQPDTIRSPQCASKN